MQEETTKRVSSLEGRVREMEQRIAVVEVNVKTSNKIQEKFEKALCKFGEILDDIRITMIKINSEMELRNQNQQEMKEDIGSLEKWIRKLENRGKFDFLGFIVDKVLPSLITGGVVYGIIKIIELTQ